MLPSKEHYEVFYNSIHDGFININFDDLKEDKVVCYALDFPVSTFYKYYKVEGVVGNGYFSVNGTHDANSGYRPVKYSSFTNSQDGHITIYFEVSPSSTGSCKFSFADNNKDLITNLNHLPLDQQPIYTQIGGSGGNGGGSGGDGGSGVITTIPDEDNPINKDEPVVIPIGGDDDSGVLNSIIEGIKIFIETVIKNLLIIISVCIALGIIGRGALWLWHKAKNWLANT